MNVTIAIVFTVVYLVEATFLFFLGNSTHKILPLAIALVIALAAIWGTYSAVQKYAPTHPTLILLVVGIVLVVAMIAAL